MTALENITFKQVKYFLFFSDLEIYTYVCVYIYFIYLYIYFANRNLALALMLAFPSLRSYIFFDVVIVLSTQEKRKISLYIYMYISIPRILENVLRIFEGALITLLNSGPLVLIVRTNFRIDQSYNAWLRVCVYECRYGCTRARARTSRPRMCVFT